MGKIKGYIGEFLWDARGLGYDESNLPSLADMERVVIERMPIWEYHGKTEEELSDMPTV